MNTTAISISGDAAIECAKALAAGLTPDQRMALLAETLPQETRAAAYKELLYDLALVTTEEAAAMAHWTPSGFLRVATRENLPHIKLGHKQPALFRFRDVDTLFQTLRIWPKGKPITPFKQAA